MVRVRGAASLVPAVMLNPRQLWIKPRYVADHLWLTVWSLALFLLVSLTLAALCYALLPAPGLAGNVHMESAWVLRQRRAATVAGVVGETLVLAPVDPPTSPNRPADGSHLHPGRTVRLVPDGAP